MEGMILLTLIAGIACIVYAIEKTSKNDSFQSIHQQVNYS